MSGTTQDCQARYLHTTDACSWLQTTCIDSMGFTPDFKRRVMFDGPEGGETP
jgi:hypothetical protein